MSTPQKRMKLALEGRVFTTPICLDDEREHAGSTPSGSRKRALEDCTDDQTNSVETDEAGSGLGMLDKSCSSPECLARERQLEERNRQRDELRIKLESVREKNKEYLEKLEQKESKERNTEELIKMMQDNYSTQLYSHQYVEEILMQELINSEQLFKRLRQAPPGHSSNAPAANLPAPGDEASSGVPWTARLSSIIAELRAENKALQEELNDTKAEMTRHKNDCTRKIAKLRSDLAERDNARLLTQDTKENAEQAANRGTGSCSTDTEKQLEKIQRENKLLTKEISSLKRFYDRNPTLSYGPEAEKLRRAEEEKETLSRQLSDCSDLLRRKERQWTENEADMEAKIETMENEKFQVERKLNRLEQKLIEMKNYRTDLKSSESSLRTQLEEANATVRRTAQMLREMKTNWAVNMAKDPEVVTKVVQVEVESEDAKTKMVKQEKQLAEWTNVFQKRDQIVDNLSQEVAAIKERLEKVQEENSMLKKLLEEKTEKERHSEEQEISEAYRKMVEHMQNMEKSLGKTRLDAINLQAACDSLKMSYTDLAREAHQFPDLIDMEVVKTQNEMMKVIEEIMERYNELLAMYRHEMKRRKEHYNQLVELKGNIRVLCRVRPVIREDGTGPQAENVVTYNSLDDGLVHINNKGRSQTFYFDKVFSDNSSQTEVFDEVKDLVTSCVDGYNVCIFAYGQTGSGKTFTMEGSAEDPGINQRALRELFVETADKGDWNFTIEVSVMEIYNETIRDLLNSDNSNKLEVKMKVDESGYHVPGLVTKEVTSLQEVNQVFEEGRKNRATASTNMNEHSSRSHCLLCVSVVGVNRTTRTVTHGRLNLVDLAGSERVSKSGADGVRLKEAQSINRSLLCLGEVIHALRSKRSHIPFRNSKLTYLLQDSLGGDSKTLMIIQVAPVEKNVLETSCSLHFGQHVRTVEKGAATRKIEAGDSEMKSPTSPTSPGSPPLKRKILSPRSSPATTPQTRFTASKSSPASTRVMKYASRK